MSKTWFITGASRGFGREFALAALERGDRVAGTARRPQTLDDLAQKFPDAFVPLALDVTDPQAIADAVNAAQRALGDVDVVVNNAGYGQFGAVEELSDDEFREQWETNVVGPLRITRAFLPAMRERGSGHIVQVSSIGGVAAFANLGAYHASKWALEAWSESLAAEVARFGIKVTIVEPGGFDTDWAGPSSKHATPLPAYEPMREEARQRRAAAVPGDPAAAAQALLQVVDADEPPLRVLFGTVAPGLVKGVYERRLAQMAGMGAPQRGRAGRRGHELSLRSESIGRARPATGTMRAWDNDSAP